jgi:pimeloyl-ACP methyl ester carboxylesterase
MRANFVTVDGVPTRFYEAGKGETILLVHGVGSSADTWIGTVKALASQFRVIAVDLLGHGMTGDGSYEAGPPQPAMVKHILALKDHLGLRRLSLCGSSYGAMIALFAYFEIKSCVDRLVLISSASATLAPAERLRAVEAAYANTVAAYDKPTWQTSLERMRRLFHDPTRVPEDIALIQLTLFSLPGRRERFEIFMHGLMEPESAQVWRVDNRFGEIEVPLLMVWGKNDKSVDAARALELARQVPEAYFAEIPDCGHIPHLEQPDIVNPILAAFFSHRALPQYRVRP